MLATTVGIITYNHKHLKTEQVVFRLIEKGYDLRIYALPFINRKSRVVQFRHRPDQETAAHVREIARFAGIPFTVCQEDTDIDNSCDRYLVLAGRILSQECVKDKKILNCHPGIIPISRGLDSFKWAIYEMKPVGNTLHYIDAEVDAGEVLATVPTPILPSDTIASLARRHYEKEIEITVDFERYTAEGNAFSPARHQARFDGVCPKISKPKC